MNVIKWIIMLPAALLGAVILAGLALKLGAYISADIAFLEGLAIYSIYGTMPSIACLIGLSIAPNKTGLVKWVILIPLILVITIVYIPAIFALLFGGFELTAQDRIQGFDALHENWQLGLSSFGLLMGAAYAGFQPVSEYTNNDNE